MRESAVRLASRPRPFFPRPDQSTKFSSVTSSSDRVPSVRSIKVARTTSSFLVFSKQQLEGLMHQLDRGFRDSPAGAFRPC